MRSPTLSDCGFTLAHYREVLQALVQIAPVRGFRDQQPSGPQVILRHDVDLDLLTVPPMLEVEVALAVPSTYFFRLTAETYNLMSETGRRVLRQVIDAGGSIGLHFDAGLHALPPGAALEAAVEEEMATLGRIAGVGIDAVSFHRPQPALLGWRPRRAISAYDPSMMMPQARYISDSAMEWREGCFHRHLDPVGWDERQTLQVLVHPEWWAEHPGDVAARVDAFHRRSEARFEATVRREVRSYGGRESL